MSKVLNSFKLGITPLVSLYLEYKSTVFLIKQLAY